MPQPLLLTKLYIPQSPSRHISRQDLREAWLKGFLEARRLTLICAPAGYGKTSLMAELIKAAPAVPVWISLDEGDNDAKRLMAYLFAALKKAGVSLDSGIEPLLNDGGFPAADTVLPLLIGSVSVCDTRILLVLDDYHLIHAEKVHGLVKFLLAHQPQNLHIALLTREDPPLPLFKLRMGEEMMELRLGDLLFSAGEAGQMLSGALDAPLSEPSVQRITARTEGWAAGLKLFALALKGLGPKAAEDCLQRLDGTHAYIIDYLVEEVMAAQPEAIREFLQKTSVLERMDGPLCDALTGASGGQEMLREVARCNLFLIPLDDRREWYRYHALFADSLKVGLHREEEHRLCAAAATHMKRHGFLSEAVEYAFRSGDMALATAMVEDAIEDTFRTAQLDTLLGWMDRLPQERVIGSEALCVRRPIACFITGRMGEGQRHLDALGPDFEKTASPHNRGLLYALRAMMAGAAGQDAELLAQEALRYLEPFDPIARTSALNTLGRAQYCKGKVKEAVNTFEMALQSALTLGRQFVTTLSMMNYSACLGVLGRQQEAIAACEDYIAGIERQYGQLPPYVGILYVTLAWLHQALGEQAKAFRYQTEGDALCKRISYDGAASLRVFTDALPKAETDILLPFGEKLSARELEIMKLLGEGLSNGEIAQALFISINTAQWHLSHLYSKLGAKSRTQAVAKARELGLLK